MGGVGFENDIVQDIIIIMELAKYYAFTRVNPKPSDYVLLVEACRSIGAYMGYRTIRDGNVVRLFGFIVVWEAFPTGGSIERLFPNFNLTYLKDTFDNNLLKLVKMKERGNEPFVSVRRVLFANADGEIDGECVFNENAKLTEENLCFVFDGINLKAESK